MTAPTEKEVNELVNLIDGRLSSYQIADNILNSGWRKTRVPSVEEIFKTIEETKCPDGFPRPSYYEIAQAIHCLMTEGTDEKD